MSNLVCVDRCLLFVVAVFAVDAAAIQFGGAVVVLVVVDDDAVVDARICVSSVVVPLKAHVVAAIRRHSSCCCLAECVRVVSLHPQTCMCTGRTYSVFLFSN